MKHFVYIHQYHSSYAIAFVNILLVPNVNYVYLKEQLSLLVVTFFIIEVIFGLDQMNFIILVGCVIQKLVSNQNYLIHLLIFLLLLDHVIVLDKILHY